MTYVEGDPVNNTDIHGTCIDSHSWYDAVVDGIPEHVNARMDDMGAFGDLDMTVDLVQ